MNEYKLNCCVSHDESLTARVTLGRERVEIMTHDVEGYAGNVLAAPDAVRIFARGLLALADEVDGGEDPEDAPSVKVGDRFQITRDRVEFAGVSAGDLVTVVSVDSYGGFRATAEGDPRVWGFGLYNIGDGLERVDDEPAPAPSIAPERRAILEEARSLVGSLDVGQLLETARFLAGDPR